MADSWAAVPKGTEPPKFILPEGKTPQVSTDSWAATPKIPLTPFKISPKSPSDVENQPGWEGPGRSLARITAKGLPIIGGIAGAFGGAPGSAIGAGAGSNAGAALEAYLDNKPAPSGIDQAKTFAGNAALTFGGGKVAGMAAEAFPNQARLASIIANTMFGQGVRGAENIVGKSEEAPSVGTFGKDLATNAALDLVLGKILGKTVGRDQTPVEVPVIPTEISLPQGVGELRSRLQVGTGPLPPNAGDTRQRSTAEHGAGAQIALKGNLSTAHAVEKQAYKTFEINHVNNNVAKIPQVSGWNPSSPGSPEVPAGTGTPGSPAIPPTPKTPIITTVDIKGPIYTTESTLQAARFKPTIDGFLQGPEFQSLPQFQQTRFKQLGQAIDKLVAGTPSVDPKTGTQGQIPVLEYNTAKEMKTLISQTTGGKINKTLAEGGLTELAKSLDKDIDTSVSNWKGGQQAKLDLDLAHDATTFKKRVFTAEFRKHAMYGKGEDGKADIRTTADPEQVFKDAYKSQENATKMLERLGLDNHSFIKGDYFDNVLMKKAFGKGQEKFEPRKIIDEFADPNSVSRVILSANERNSISQFMKAAEASSPEAGQGTLRIKDRIASVIIGQVAGGATGLPGARQTVNIGTQQLLKAMLENPKIAEYATRLVKIPNSSTSTQGQQLTKLLMRGLRGSEVTLVTDEGEKQGTVTENGMIKFN